jgi:hypothetical protein
MKSEQYRSWLKLQGYADNTIAAQMHRAGRVESHYGDLDELHAKDGLNPLLVELKYTQADRQNNRPNPTKIPFDGVPYNNLASYRDDIRRYKRFKEEGFVEVDQSFEFEQVLEACKYDKTWKVTIKHQLKRHKWHLDKSGSAARPEWSNALKVLFP